MLIGEQPQSVRFFITSFQFDNEIKLSDPVLLKKYFDLNQIQPKRILLLSNCIWINDVTELWSFSKGSLMDSSRSVPLLI